MATIMTRVDAIEPLDQGPFPIPIILPPGDKTEGAIFAR
jgi:hypothetical protein